MIMHDSIRLLVAKKISETVTSLNYEMSLEDIYKGLSAPPNPEMGDLTFGCFILAKNCKKAPPLVAQELAQSLKTDGQINHVAAAGPYLNFRLNASAYGALVLSDILAGSFFKKQIIPKSPKTMIEFSQPNTHKELHVGHMRNLCLGESLIRLFRYSGREVLASTFPGDMGTHVAKCLWYLKKHNQEPIPEHNKGEWLGKMYSKGHLLLEDQLGSEKEEQNRQEITSILQQLEAQQGEYYNLWLETRQWSIDLMKQVYDWAEVKFDDWYFESEMDSPSIKWVKELYAEGKLEKSEGAIGKNLESEKLGFCLLLKSDGNGLYATKDLLLAKHKFENRQIEKSIYVVDMRQALHFKQVFRVLELLGFSQAKDCFHLQYNYVELPDGAMSSRKGN
ncbi:MAG: arginine--tRNA ligase, partial [Bdellovibrionia bacterium]